MLECLEDKYCLNFSPLIKRGKQYKYVINIPFVEDRLQAVRTIFEPFIFKTAHRNVRVLELDSMETP